MDNKQQPLPKSNPKAIISSMLRSLLVKIVHIRFTSLLINRKCQVGVIDLEDSEKYFKRYFYLTSAVSVKFRDYPPFTRQPIGVGNITIT